MAQDWPETAERLPESPVSRPTPDTHFAARVSALIQKVSDADQENRNRAARRLARLYIGGALNSAEAERFGKALWSAESRTAICQLILRFMPTCFSCCRLPTSKQRGLYLWRARMTHLLPTV